MRLYEYEASALFAKEGIPVPEHRLAQTPQEARRAAQEVGLPVVVKAQVLAGGRGLAGGVQAAHSLEQVAEVTSRILGSCIGGLPVGQVLVARKVEVTRELYLGVVVDGYEGLPRVILSTEGGLSVEEVARTRPEKLFSRHVSLPAGLRPFEARQMAREAGLAGAGLVELSGILNRLYQVFCKYDALIAEVNPLAQTSQGAFLALDAKMEIDDASLYRHPELKGRLLERIQDPLERQGRELGVTYVDLGGTVGIIASGAGLGMATMDLIAQRYRPANFLETGGNISEELLYQVMGLVLQKKGLRAVFINLYGGINPIHEGVRGIVRYLREHGVAIPVVAKALGNRQEETWAILREGGVRVVTKVETEAAVQELFGVLEERGG